MIRRAPLPPDIDARHARAGAGARAGRGLRLPVPERRLRPLSDVDVAVYLEDGTDPVEEAIAAQGAVTTHLGTDEVDLVVLNSAPAALLGRLLRTRRVILDRDPLRRHRFESLALRTALDFQIVEHRTLARRFARG